MNGAERERALRSRLQAAFDPIELQIEDESRHHAGHAGAAAGMGHFRIKITARAFVGLSVLARHRRIYAELTELLKTDVHALAIEARAPEEQAR